MTLGIGIVGVSHWYFALGVAYQVCNHPGAKLVALAHSDGDLVKQMAKTYRAERWYRDYQDLLADRDVDAVVVATTTQLQPKVAMEAAQAGKHLLVGKPIARTLDEADALLKVVDESGRVLVAVASRPSNEDPIKHAIASGKIGTPYAIHLASHAIEPLSEPGKREPGWFVDAMQAAGGAFIDHAIYDVALARWYLEDEVVSVRGFLRNFCHPEWQVEDYGVALLQFGKGGVASVESTFTGHDKTRNRKTVLGSEGRIEWIEDQVWMFSKSSTEQAVKNIILLEEANPVYQNHYVDPGYPQPPYPQAQAPFLNELIDCIRTGVEPVATGMEARSNLEVCLSAYISAATGADVALPLKTHPDVAELLDKNETLLSGIHGG